MMMCIDGMDVILSVMSVLCQSVLTVLIKI